MIGWADTGAVILGGAGVALASAAAIVTAPAWVPIAAGGLIVGSIGLTIYSNVFETQQTIDKNVDKFKDITKDHFDEFDEFDKASGRECP